MKRKIIIRSILITGLVVVIINLWFYIMRQDLSEPYRFVTAWGILGVCNGFFLNPTSITLDKEENVYVSDCGLERIQKFTSTGKFITKWGSHGVQLKNDDARGQFRSLKGLCADSEGNIYAVDENNRRIQKFDSSGNFLTMWEDSDYPRGIAIDSKQYIYILEHIYVVKFNFKNKFITKWKAISSKHYGCDYLGDIALDSRGYVYITGGFHHRNSYVYKFDSSGKFITRWGIYGKENQPFTTAGGIGIDSKDNIFVVESGKNRIQVFNSDGKFIKEWGASGFWIGYFHSPGDIAIDSDGNVYVVDTGNNRIQKFSPNPEFKTK